MRVNGGRIAAVKKFEYGFKFCFNKSKAFSINLIL